MSQGALVARVGGKLGLVVVCELWNVEWVVEVGV